MKKSVLQRKTPLRAKTGFIRSTSRISSKNTGKVAKCSTKEGVKVQRSMAKLKKDLDTVFSQFIRQKYANELGMVKCYTCSTIKHWKEQQNGHWIPRNNLATRFSESNCRPQCVGCNMFQKGQPDIFAVNLIKEGIDIVALQESRYAVFKVDRAWYMEKIIHYKNLLI